jgi:hypothetical protein
MPPLGNNRAEKFKTPKARRELHTLYCSHLSKGLTQKSFHVDDETMKRYVQKYPEDFPEDELAMAFSKQRIVWEENLLKLARGEISGSATATIFGLKNIAGWRDRIDHAVDDKDTATFIDTPQNRLALALKLAFILSNGAAAREAGATLDDETQKAIEAEYG